MSRKPLILGLALAGALSINPASAAMKASEALDGLWFSQTESGRGISVDFIPSANGGGSLFGAVFSFNDTGENRWVTIQVGFEENEFQSTGDLFVTTGGTFGFPFTPPTTVDIGDVTVRLNTCESIEFDIDVDEGTGFEDVVLDLEPLSTVASSQCVYEQPFTGCPDFATDSGTGLRECLISGQILDREITLTNNTTWVLDGLLEIGAPNANNSVLNVEPGTVITSVPDTNNTFIYVHAGSDIYADGLPYAPIVWTSAFDGFGADDGGDPEPGDTGGLAVAGLAPCNSSNPGEVLGCDSEFATAEQVLSYGGDDPGDSSGSITYMQIRYAGIFVGENREVNTFSLLGVGNGTTLSHIQAYNSLDDGIEFFGGTVNMRYGVFVDGLDDYVDWDEGWSGKAQYGLIVVNDEPGSGAGFEGANNGDNFDALPRATPIFSNFTVVSRNDTDDAAFLLKEGTGAQIWNSIGTGYGGECILIEDQATVTAAGTPQAPTGTIAFAGTFVNDCVTLFRSDDQPGFAEALFNAFPGNSTADPMLDPVTLQPMPGSPVLTSGIQVFDLGTQEIDQFFNFEPYSGAFDGTTDWTEGWTFDPQGTAR